MHRDRPTVPNLHSYDQGRLAAPEEPGEFERPAWPVAGPRRRGLMDTSSGDVRTLVLGASLGVNVVLLIGLFALLLLGQGGLLAGHGAAAGSNPGGSTSGAGLGQPTATSSVTPGSGGWLRLTPSSVQLGCTSDQRNQYVVLANSGPQSVHWQVDLSGAANQAGITVSPTEGDLEAGATIPLRVHYSTHSDQQQGTTGQQGVIPFKTESSNAGQLTTLSFTIVPCA